MINLIYFTKEEELEELTGLNHDELWDNDFNLDDWDFGLCTDVPLYEEHYDDIDDCTYTYKEAVADSEYLLFWFDASPYDWECTEYNGKYYYMRYH